MNKINIPPFTWVGCVDSHEYSLSKMFQWWLRKENERCIQTCWSHWSFLRLFKSTVNLSWFRTILILLIIDMRMLFKRHWINWNSVIIHWIYIHLKIKKLISIRNNFFLNYFMSYRLCPDDDVEYCRFLWIVFKKIFEISWNLIRLILLRIISRCFFRVVPIEW